MTSKNKGGRPQKTLSDDQLIEVEKLAAYLTVEQIADFFSIGKTTFYRIAERQPEVMERYKKGKSKLIASVAQSLIKKARDGDTTSAIFLLKTQGGWSEKQVIDHTSSDGSMTPTVIERRIVDPRNDIDD